MSSISSIIANSSYSSLYSTQRSNASQMAADLFSQLDTTGKGYIDETQLATALSGLSSSSSSSSASSASQLFSSLDSDSDGKITESELTSGFSKLAEALDSQYNQSRMQDATGSMPPPPPPSNDTGFTKDELTQQLSEIGSSDSQRSSLISSVVSNFSAADTNGDGKVTFQEASAYSQSTSATSSTSTTSSSTSSNSDSSSSSSNSSTTQTSDAQMFRQLMDLLRLYGNSSSDNSSSNLLSTLISTSV